MKLVKLSFLTAFVTIILLLLLTAMVEPQRILDSEVDSFRIESLAENLNHPWSLAFLPDGRMLISERGGRLLLFDKSGKQRQEISGLPQIAARGQGGLLDLALHPNFAENRQVYFAYAGAGPAGVGTEVARGKLLGTRLTETETIFRMLPKSGTGRHFGARLVFDAEGYLYITLGDRGEKERAQKPDDHAGSVIRLHADGSIPADNPFVGRQGWKNEKYTLGHRNQQGAALHPETGLLWTHEHGPQGGDEINIIRPGTNYGWPVITYGVNYGSGSKIGEGTQQDGMAQPIHYWVPSIAPSGMLFYTGQQFPKWTGNLFVGALKDQMLVRLVLEGERIVHEERLLKNTIGRIRDVRQGPDGLIYLLTDHGNGRLVRLTPALRH